MRRTRHLVAAIFVLSFCVAPAAWAQEGKLFQNSWFWGVHVGSTNLGTPTQSSKMAGSFGAEWMITRSVVGLYVAYDQAQFHRTSQIADPTTSSGTRPVAISGMRTGSIAMVAFPKQFGAFRPYAGLGFQLNLIGSAAAGVDSAGTLPGASTDASVDDARSNTAPFFMLGGQLQQHKVALFGQVSFAPSTTDFLINSSITTLSVGLRYNFGRSIDF